LKQSGDYCSCDITDCTICCLWKRWINCGISSLKYIDKIWILYFGLGFLGQYCNWIQARQAGFDSPHRQVWDQPISCWVGTIDCGYVLTYIHMHVSSCVQYTYVHTYITLLILSFIHFLEPEFSLEWQISHGKYSPFRTSGNIKSITISREVCWEYSSQSTDPTILWHSVMFITETFEMRTVTIILVKLRQNGEAILETYELFIFENRYYITNSVCKNVLCIYLHFLCFHIIINILCFLHVAFRKIHR